MKKAIVIPLILLAAAAASAFLIGGCGGADETIGTFSGVETQMDLFDLLEREAGPLEYAGSIYAMLPNGEEVQAECEPRIFETLRGGDKVRLSRAGDGWEVAGKVTIESGIRIELRPLGIQDEGDLNVAMVAVGKSLDALGLYEHEVIADGDLIIVRVPKGADIEAFLEMAANAGELQFREVLEIISQEEMDYDGTQVTGVDPDDTDAYLALRDEEIVLEYEGFAGGKEKVVMGPSRLPGLVIEEMSVDHDEGAGTYALTFQLSQIDTPGFAELTEELENRQLAIVFDYRIITIPTVHEPITDGRVSITGAFDEEEIESLEGALKNGSLPVIFKGSPLVEEF